MVVENVQLHDTNTLWLGEEMGKHVHALSRHCNSVHWNGLGIASTLYPAWNPCCAIYLSRMSVSCASHDWAVPAHA